MEHEDADLLAQVVDLQQQVAQLRQAMVSHAVVDRAIGVVVTYGGLSPETGWKVLKDVSQHSNTKLREVAEQLVQWPYGNRLPEGLRYHLEVALKHSSSHPGPVPMGRDRTAVHGPAGCGCLRPVSLGCRTMRP